jgi:putative peptidoglycan lipid II flippase
MVVWPLLFYTLGLCGYLAQQVVARAFYSMQDSTTPVKSAVLAVVINFILNITLVWFMGTGGLAAATAICSYLQVIILTVLFQRWLHKQDASLSLWRDTGAETLKVVLASLYMCAAIALAIWLSKNWPNILKLIVIVSAAAGTYLIAAKIMRIEMLSLLTGTKPKNGKLAASSIYD